jgi:regulator of replication initiation timing
MDEAKRKTSFLKHIAELITQNKTLVAENEKLSSQNEKLLQEIEKYKQSIDKSDIQNKQISSDRIPKVVKYNISTVPWKWYWQQ